VQAIGRQPQRAPDGAPLHYERHRPEQTTFTAWYSSTRPASSSTPRPAPDRSCPGSSRTSSTPSSTAASWRTACRDCAAASAATTSCWPSAASGGGSARHVVRGGCRRPRRTWWTTSSRTCLCGNGCCRCRSRCACCWPRSPSWPRRCCRWYTHEARSQRAARRRGDEQAAELLPAVHRVASLAKRWILGTHQGAIDHAHLHDYLNEFVFRFNRRHSRRRGMVFLPSARACCSARSRALRRHRRGLSAAQAVTDATLLARQAGQPRARSGRSTLEVWLNGEP